MSIILKSGSYPTIDKDIQNFKKEFVSNSNVKLNVKILDNVDYYDFANHDEIYIFSSRATYDKTIEFCKLLRTINKKCKVHLMVRLLTFFFNKIFCTIKDKYQSNNLKIKVMNLMEKNAMENHFEKINEFKRNYLTFLLCLKKQSNNAIDKKSYKFKDHLKIIRHMLNNDHFEQLGENEILI